MIFREELAQAIVEGRKTVTRRRRSDNPRSPWSRERCAYRVGQVFAVQPGRGKARIAEALVVAVDAEELCKVETTRAYRGSKPRDHWHLFALPEWEKEGFVSLRAFEDAWEALNGDYKPLEIVWRIEFELIAVREGAST